MAFHVFFLARRSRTEPPPRPRGAPPPMQRGVLTCDGPLIADYAYVGVIRMSPGLQADKGSHCDGLCQIFDSAAERFAARITTASTGVKMPNARMLSVPLEFSYRLLYSCME